MFAKLKQRTLVRSLLWQLGLLKPYTQTSAAERECIAKHAQGRKQLVEIGVFNGVTTLQIRRAMALEGVLWGIDPFYPGRLGYSVDEQISRWSISQSNRGTVQLVKLTGMAAAAEHITQKRPTIDFLFVDGDHSWTGIDGDWKAWSPLIASGGVVALHDSRSPEGKPLTLDSVRYTQEVIRTDPQFFVIDEVDSLTVLQAR